MVKKLFKKIDTQLDRLPVNDRAKDAIFGLGFGLIVSLLVLGIVIFVTRESRPTQYVLQLLQSSLGF